MTIATSIVTVLCVIIMARWLLTGRPETAPYVQHLPDGSVPDFDAASTPAAAPEAVSDTEDAQPGSSPARRGGTDAADLVRSGSTVPAHSDAGAAGEGDDVAADEKDEADAKA